MKEKRYMTIFKSLLLATASFAFLSCSNLFGGDSSESSSSEKKSSDKANTITITGNISISDELKESGALPAEYLFLFNQINDSNERSAFPSTSSTNYYATATKDGTNFINGTITTTANGANFTMAITPIDDTPTTWTIEAGLKDSSDVIILNDTWSDDFSNTNPSFSHDFVIKPLASGSGNIDLTISSTTSTANTPDTLELYLNGTKVTAGEGETISTSKIFLKDRAKGVYKAKLIFKKNGYVVFTDYQGITVFPNMTTNTWVNSKSSITVPINGSTYTLTDTLVQDYLLTQIYVGSVTIGTSQITGNDDTGNGTVFAPYATFAKAITFLKEYGNTGKDYTIWISGVLIGPFTIQDETSPAKPVKAQSLTLSGYTGNTTDKLIGGSSGSVLYLDTSVPVTIKNLTITGGKGTTVDSKLYGGGLYINKGSVELTTGVVVDGNTADIGGGICLNTGALYINDTAVVGKPGVTECAKNENGKYGNKATISGGGIGVIDGTLWLGYSPASTPEEATTTGGVLYNLVVRTGETHGAGIDNNNGTINIAHGYVSYNYACGLGTGNNDDGEYVGCGGGIATAYLLNLSGDAQISNNKSAYGGAVYITKGINPHNGKFTMSGGTITSNNSEKQHECYGDGGGVAVGGSGTFIMSGGTLESNTAERWGGAVYHHGTSFEITGTTAKIIAGNGAKDNDISLWPSSGFCIKVSGSTGHTGTDSDNILVTPTVWTRGYQLFTTDSITDFFSRFKITDSEWSIVAYNDGTYESGRLDAPLWVSESAISGVTGGVAGDDDTGNGTKRMPYKTIKKAVSQCWGGPNDYGTGVSRIINIVGTLNGAQEIDSGVTTSKASAIVLEGKPIGISSAGSLTGGFTSESQGRPLTIGSAVPIKIQNLTITGGYTTNGGGIYASVANARLTLSTGAIVDGNSAEEKGGGIYFAGVQTNGNYGTLIMESTSIIRGNSTITGTDSNGGGIYLKCATLYMSGNSLIGDNSDTYTKSAKSDSYSNYSKGYGGGIFAEGSSVYLGYNSSGSVSALGDAYGICYNYSYSSGGGIYLDSASFLYMGSGKISKNRANENGGGICNNGKVYLHTNALIGDTRSATATSDAHSNRAEQGGGILSSAGGIYLGYSGKSGSNLVASNFNSGKGIIGNYAQSTTSSTGGGGIYCSGGELKINSGEVSFNGTNTSSSYYLCGGGVKFTSSGTFEMSGGTIASNKTYKYGGGVYIDTGTFTMTNGTIGDSSRDAPITGEANCSNCAGLGGGVYISSNGTANLNGGIIAANMGTNNSEGGGGIYVAGTATIKNTIRYNGSVKPGGGIYVYSDNCTLDGATLLQNYIAVASDKKLQLKSVSFSGNATKDIQLMANSSRVTVAAELSGTGGIARLQPYSYATTTQVLEAASGVELSPATARFAVTPNETEQWSIGTGGKLEKGITANGVEAYISTLAANEKTAPHNLQITISSADDVTAINTVLKTGGRYVDVTFTNETLTDSMLPDYYAFAYCNYLVGITFPSGLESIPNYGLYSCSNLSRVSIPDSVTRIKNAAFCDCSSLSSITLPPNLVYAGGGFSYTRSGLTSLTIPASVSYFSGLECTTCSKLTSFSVANENSDYKNDDYGVVYSKDGKKLVAIPTGKTDPYEIAGGTVEIKSNCCLGGKLTVITIPETVTKIGESAFESCSSLGTIYFNGTSTQWNNITKETNWSKSISATIVYCSDINISL